MIQRGEFRMILDRKSPARWIEGAGARKERLTSTLRRLGQRGRPARASDRERRSGDSQPTEAVRTLRTRPPKALRQVLQWVKAFSPCAATPLRRGRRLA